MPSSFFFFYRKNRVSALTGVALYVVQLWALKRSACGWRVSVTWEGEIPSAFFRRVRMACVTIVLRKLHSWLCARMTMEERRGKIPCAQCLLSLHIRQEDTGVPSKIKTIPVRWRCVVASIGLTHVAAEHGFTKPSLPGMHLNPVAVTSHVTSSDQSQCRSRERSVGFSGSAPP